MDFVSRGALPKVVAGMFLTALALASTAHAQSPPQKYVLAGWSLEFREGSRYGGGGDYPRRALTGVMFGGGVSVAANISLEAAVSAFLPNTTDWHFGYLFGNKGDKHTVDRDVLLTALARWSQPCAGLVCVDILAGGGFSLHAVSTTALTSCPSVGPCVDLEPSRAESEPDHAEPLLIAGLDFKVQISKRLTLVPGVRAGAIWRKEYLTAYLSRGPSEGSGAFVTANVAVLYALK